MGIDINVQNEVKGSLEELENKFKMPLVSVK